MVRNHEFTDTAHRTMAKGMITLRKAISPVTGPDKLVKDHIICESVPNTMSRRPNTSSIATNRLFNRKSPPSHLPEGWVMEMMSQLSNPTIQNRLARNKLRNVGNNGCQKWTHLGKYGTFGTRRFTTWNAVTSSHIITA